MIQPAVSEHIKKRISEHVKKALAVNVLFTVWTPDSETRG